MPKVYDPLIYRIARLPEQLERARARHRHLVAEAKRYRMLDILTDEEKAA